VIERAAVSPMGDRSISTLRKNLRGVSALFQSLTFRSSATTKVIGSCIASIDARRFRNRCGIIEPPR
jgi:hypothetical protein